DSLRRDLLQADRFYRGYRGEHALATAKQVSAAPLSPGARHHLFLQQMPAHGPEYPGEAPRLPGGRRAGDCLAAGVRPRPRSRGAEPAQMTLVPNRFLFRFAHPCRFVPKIPKEGDQILDLPDACRIDNFAALDERRNYADVRLAWNDFGLGLQ